MNILTLTEAQSLHTDAVESTEEGSDAVAAILSQLITHLNTDDKVVQISNTTTMNLHYVIALKGDGSMWRLTNGSAWIKLQHPSDHTQP